MAYNLAFHRAPSYIDLNSLFLKSFSSSFGTFSLINTLSLKNRNLFINVLIGIALLSIPILTSPDFNTNVSLFKVSAFRQNFLRYILLLLLFFGHYYLLIPKMYSKKRWWLYGSILIGSFFIISYLPSVLVEDNMPLRMSGQKPPGSLEVREPPFDLFRFRDTFIFQFAMVVILSLLLRLDDQLKVIKSEKLKAEVSYLKAQINPHFLFNTLNSIYALTLTKSDKAPNAVLKLSDMMRYVVTESDTEKVALAKELQYISDYVALQQLRMGKQVDFKFDVKGNASGKEIAPIILINYVENAFKYGINPDKPSKISICITIDEKGVKLETENNIVVEKNALMLNTQEGTKNTIQRLDFLYHGKYNLKVSETKEVFQMTLYIDLT